MKTIEIKFDNVRIELAINDKPDASNQCGAIVGSNLRDVMVGKREAVMISPWEDDMWDQVTDTIEALALAHACAGIDVTDPKYIEGLRTALDALENNLI